jgi:hypothetical protein
MGRLFILTGGDAQPTYMSERWGKPLSEIAAADPSTLLFDASRAEVEGALEGMRIVAFFGHGSPSTLGRPEVIDLQNIHLANGVVIAVACRSSQLLGPASVANGAKAYVGFDDDIPVFTLPTIDKLIRDGFAKLVAGTESPAEFKASFKAACQQVQDTHYWVKRGERAYVIAMDAQILKKSLEVL